MSDDDDEFFSRGKKNYTSKLSDDDLSTGRSWRRERIKLSDDDDEFSSRGKKTKLSDEDSDLGRSRKSKRDYGAELEDDSDDDFLARRRRDRIKLTDDEDFSTSRKTTTSKLSDGEKEKDLSPSHTRRRDYTTKLSDGEGEFLTRRHRKEDYPSKYNDNDLDHSDEDFKSKRGKHDYSNKSNGIEESNQSKFTNGTNEFSSPKHHSLITDPYQADKVATGMATSNGTEPEPVSKKGENEGERRKSVNEIVSGEQEQVYAASQRRRRQRQRRRTADAESKLRSPDHQASAL